MLYSRLEAIKIQDWDSTLIFLCVGNPQGYPISFTQNGLYNDPSGIVEPQQETCGCLSMFFTLFNSDGMMIPKTGFRSSTNPHTRKNKTKKHT